MLFEFTAKQRARFLPKVDTSGTCHLWTSAPYPNGYGRWHIAKGVNLLAHRAAWMLAYGDIPDGLDVCHTCDVRLCVRLDHLWLGTRQENILDMHAKGRAVHQVHPELILRGSRHAFAKLTEAAVLAIRASYIPYRTPMIKLAAEYGVSEHTISRVLHGESWKHVRV